MKILAIYRGKLNENRGTPIRIKTILSYLAKESDIDFSVASWDDIPPLSTKFFNLSNRHLSDLKIILGYVKENKVDIVIGHTMSSWYYLLFIKIFTKAKIVLEMHGFIEEEALLYGSISRTRYFLDKAKYSLFYRTCHLITTCSQTAADIIFKFNKNTVAVFGGADTSVFSPNVPVGNFIKKDGRIILGYVGNARVWQGTDFLIRMYKKLKSKMPQWRLVMVLSEAKAKKDPDIEYLGPLPHEDVPKFLAECDVLVIPRPDNEVNRISFASKLPEYMAMGKPVISSRTSDADRIITDGANGILYEPEDEKDFERAILKLSDTNTRKVIGDSALKTITSKFSWDRQVAQIAKHLRILYYKR